MRNAYLFASEKVCSLRDDAPKSWMQNADMDRQSNHLGAWRQFRHLTQQELAERVGTTKAVISNLETGVRGLSDKWLRRLAPALETTPGFLLDYNPNDLDTQFIEAALAVPQDRRDQVLAILDTFRRTGTDG